MLFFCCVAATLATLTHFVDVRRLVEEDRVFFSVAVLSIFVFVPPVVVYMSLLLVIVFFFGQPLLLLRNRAFSCAVDRMLDVDLHYFFYLLLVGDDVMLLPELPQFSL
jgi:hypothetical protein